MAEITLEQRRHSAAHLMARAVMNLFEDVQVDIGPATDDGFYYDFDLPHRLSPEDFPKIESEIARLIALDESALRTSSRTASRSRPTRWATMSRCAAAPMSSTRSRSAS